MKTPVKNRLEWTVFGVSLLLIACVAGWLVTQMVGTDQPSVRLEVTPAESRRASQGYDLAVDVVNTGDVTAESVRIEVTVPSAGGPERRDAEIEYVPYRSKRRVWVTFDADPSTSRPTARVLSYHER